MQPSSLPLVFVEGDPFLFYANFAIVEENTFLRHTPYHVISEAFAPSKHACTRQNHHLYSGPSMLLPSMSSIHVQV